MTKFTIVGCCFALCLLFGNCGSRPVLPQEAEFAGQAFIVTKGGTSIKLGLVEVYVFEEPRIANYIQEKRQLAAEKYEEYKKTLETLMPQIKPLEEEFAAAERRWKRRMTFELADKVNEVERRLKAKVAELSRLTDEMSVFYGDYWITDLPAPFRVTKTDADGLFTLRLFPGRYALAARAQRTLVKDAEVYRWLIWIDVKPENKDKLFLSNDNLLETFCPDCIVRSGDTPKHIKGN